MSAATKKPKVAKKVVVKKKTKNGYKMPAPIPRGEVLTDFTKKAWEIGTSIGIGGFGEIYEARQSGSKSSKYEYAIKIEPSENGPLFVEMHFYMKAFKIDHIQEWMQKKKLKSLGVPRFIGSGSHYFNNEKYRFIVMDRFGKDLWSLFVNNGRKFPVTTILKIAIQIVDILEYLHEKAYVHGDIKGSNLLLGIAKGAENQVFLVDYGLVSRYSTKEYKNDPKKAHNGTIEYTSRDAHFGVSTRRGDFEILAYNMLQWATSKLPWEKNLTDPSRVQNEKIKHMNNIPLLMETCFGQESPPDVLIEFFNYIVHLSPNGEPDYNYCRGIFANALKKFKCAVNSKLEFSCSSENNGPKASKGPNKTVRVTRRKQAQPALSDEDMFAESDGSESPDTEDVKEGGGKRRRNGSPLKPKVTVNTNQNGMEMSWKNCPSFLASNIVRPGEYNKQSKVDAKTRKRRKSSEDLYN